MDTLGLFEYGSIILLMQYGFALLEVGSTQSKNINYVLFKNLLNSLVAGFLYWTVGSSLAYGKGNEFIGWTKLWVFKDVSNLDLAQWYFQFTLAAATATIASGALAGRCIIYPIVTHWVWSEEGWLSKGDEYIIDGKNVTIHYKDFAGSGPVHVLGGICAFSGALILGPRIRRFHSSTAAGHTPSSRRGHSVSVVVHGGFILHAGFLAFNDGSELAISTAGDRAANSLTVANTVLSGISAAFVSLILHRLIDRHSWSLLHVINSSLAGMVVICAGCDVVRPWGAFCIGAVGGIVYRITSEFVLKLKVDDPVNAVAGFKNDELVISMSANFKSMEVIGLLRAEDSISSVNQMRKTPLSASVDDDDSDLECDLP